MESSIKVHASQSKPMAQISDISLRLVTDGTDGLIAWASCVVSNTIRLENIAIRRGLDGGLFLTYPAKRTASGSRFNYFNPITKAAADCIQSVILARLAFLDEPSMGEEAENQ